MIVLITASPNAPDFAAAIEKVTGERTLVAATVERGTKMMRAGDFSAAVIDTGLVEMDALGGDMFWRFTGSAIPVWVNLAISSPGRVVREVQAGLKRRDRERQIALRAARSALRNELKDAITGILLSSEMALQVPSLPEAAQSKLKALHDLARQVRFRLDASS
jgi:hypothetical protein